LVENPLAHALLAGDIQSGQTVQVDLQDEKLFFSGVNSDSN